jgi:hypothetical protein
MKLSQIGLAALLILSAFALGGCTTTPATTTQEPWCPVIAPVDSTIVQGIASLAQCTNPAAILSSFQAIEKCSIPAPTPAASPAISTLAKPMIGPVGIICSAVAPAIISAVVPLAATAVLPAAWGCNSSASVGTLTAGAEMLCGMIPMVKKQ